MFDKDSDPGAIAQEIGFLAGLLDYEGAREAAKVVLARLVPLALKQAGHGGGRAVAVTEDTIFNVVSDVVHELMPVVHKSVVGNAARAAAGE